jgi:hypothetical protein
LGNGYDIWLQCGFTLPDQLVSVTGNGESMIESYKEEFEELSASEICCTDKRGDRKHEITCIYVISHG